MIRSSYTAIKNKSATTIRFNIDLPRRMYAAVLRITFVEALAELFALRDHIATYGTNTIIGQISNWPKTDIFFEYITTFLYYLHFISFSVYLHVYNIHSFT